MQDNLIKDNKGTAIRIIVGGYEVAGWDEASFDSAIDIPADAFKVGEGFTKITMEEFQKQMGGM